MDDQFTKEIKTPVGEHKVVFKTMLTGAEREKVDNAQLEYVKTNDGQNFEVTDMEKVTMAQKHRLLEVSVVTIDGDGTDRLDRLRKMYEQDYEHVYNEVVEAQKKMKASMSEAS